MVWVLVASVLLLVLVIGLFLFRVYPRPLRMTKAFDEAHRIEPKVELPAVVLAAEQLLKDPPAIDEKRLLSAQRKLPAPRLDPWALGYGKQQDLSDEALWRAAKRALSQRTQRTARAKQTGKGEPS